MKNVLSKVIIKILWLLFFAWLFLFIFTPPMPDTPRSKGLINILQREASMLDGKMFSREELEDAVSHLTLNLSMNRYTQNIHYNSPSNWHVVLIPEKRKTYSNPCTLFYRISTLDFDKTTYPDIQITGEKTMRNKGMERIR